MTSMSASDPVAAMELPSATRNRTGAPGTNGARSALVAHRFENAVAVTLLATMALLPLIEAGGRAFFGRGVPGSIVLVQHLTLWVALLGAALAARSDRLLALSTQEFLPTRVRGLAKIGTALVGTGITASLCLASVDLVQIEREAGDVVAWGLRAWVVLAVLPIGFAS